MTLSALDPLIASRSLLLHPFYLKWSKGELTLEDLRVYAKEYYHLVERVPGIVERVRDRVSDAKAKSFIQENLVEEQEHVQLWERFAKSLGIAKEELKAHKPSIMVRAAITDLESVAEQGADEGIACMYALELELPKIAKTKKDGLCSFYGLTSPDAHAYFDEHMGEEKHLAVWRSFNVAPEKAEAAAETSLTAQHQVLDAVCALRGISLHC